MTWMTGLVGLAMVALGVWVAVADRDHVLRRPGLAVMALLSLWFVGLLVWHAPLQAPALPSASPTAAQDAQAVVQRSEMFLVLCACLPLACVLAFWPTPSAGVMGVLRGILLTLLFCVACVCVLTAGFAVWWDSAGGARAPLQSELNLAWGLWGVCAIGLMRQRGWFW